jgi:hypothetical protein
MTVTEQDGSCNDSDITELAQALFSAGLSSGIQAETEGVEFIRLTLEGAWNWPNGTSDDEALHLIGLGIYEALLEAIAPYRDSASSNSTSSITASSITEVAPNGSNEASS